ncbi:MAG: MmgE/PrpD family protein [Halomonadaceae bacterium]|jgi:2-methylcitrate dehydratase PrpD
MRNSTDKLVNFLYVISQQSLSEEKKYLCRLRLLDYLGVTYAGAKTLEKAAGRHDSHSTSMAGPATVLGSTWKTSPETAALLNGIYAHTTELDDGDRYGMVHPGAPVISAVLGVVQEQALGMDALLKGIYVGYEATTLLARKLQPAMKDRGYHATGTCGTIGAAMGVAAACGFSREQMKSAFCAAVTSASGILKVIRGTSELKPYNVGQAAMNGVATARVAALNLSAPSDVLEGEQGFFCMMTGNPQLSLTVVEALNAVEHVYSKPYAACRHCHGPIEAALKLRAEGSFSVRDIESVLIRTYRHAVYLHDHVEIEGSASGKMSVPYSVAVALMTGRAGMQEFSEAHVTDLEILALTGRISMKSEEELTAQAPDKRAAIVEIMTQQGNRYSTRVDLPKGEPENPMSEQELVDKFCSLAVFSGKTPEQAEQEALQMLHAANPEILLTGQSQ